MLKSRILLYAFLLFLSFIALIPLAGCGGGGAGGGGGSTGSGRDGTEQGKLSTPVINPQSGSFKKAQNVTITCSNNGAAIYYTTDGSEPTTSSKLYSTPIAILQSTTIKAKASASGHSDSDIASASLTFQQNSTFSNSMEIVPTTYQSIAYTGTAWYGIPLQAGDFLHVTVIFSQGTPSLALYDSSQAPVSAATSANGTSCDLTYSVTASGNYYFTVSQAGKASRDTVTYTMTVSTNVAGQCAAPIFAPGDGSYDFPLTVTITSGTEGALIYYTIDGTPPTTSSTLYSGSVTLSAPGTLKAIAVKSGLTDSHVSSAVYELYIHPSPSPSPSPTPTQGGGGGGGGGGGAAIVDGYIQDTGGNGISGANVSLNYQLVSALSVMLSKSASYYTVSDSTGYYKFSGVTPDSYTVKADHPDYLPNQADISVGSNQTVHQNIILYWKKAYDGGGETLESVWGTSAANVFACGSGGTILKYNGPDNPWTTITPVTGDHLDDMWGTGTRLIITGPQGYNIISTDSGATWKIYSMSNDDRLYSLWGTQDGNYILAYGVSGKIYSSTNGGQNWVEKADISGQISGPCLADIWGYGNAASNRFVIATGTGKILVSTDGGATWVVKTKPAGFGDLALNKVWGTSDGTLILIGGKTVTTTQGGLLYSKDGGNTWNQSNTILNYPTDFEIRSICGDANGSNILISGVNNEAGAATALRTSYDQYYPAVTDNFTLTLVSDALWSGSWTPDGQNIFITSDKGKILYAFNYGIGADWKSWKGAMANLYDFFGLANDSIFNCGVLGTVASYYSSGKFGSWAPVSTSAIPNKETTVLKGIDGNSSSYLVYSCGQLIDGNGTHFIIANDYNFNITIGIMNYDDATINHHQIRLNDIIMYNHNYGWSYPGYMYLYTDILFTVGMDDTSGKGVLFESQIDWVTDGTYLYNVTYYYGPLQYNDELESICGNSDGSVLICVGKNGSIKKLSYNVSTDILTPVSSVQSNPVVDFKKVRGKERADKSMMLYAVNLTKGPFKSADSGATWELVADGPTGNTVWLNEVDDVYVGGDNIYHYIDGAWQKMLASNESIITSTFACYSLGGGFGDDRVYAGCLGGMLYYYDIPTKSMKQITKNPPVQEQNQRAGSLKRNISIKELKRVFINNRERTIRISK